MVEGRDDERFFDRIIRPMLERKYDLVEVRSYAHMKNKFVDNFLKSIKAMKADYIYVRDINGKPCISAIKQEIIHNLSKIDESKIIIVVREIESWYLAGLSNKDARKFKISPMKKTDDITKEQFNNFIPKKFNSRINFMSEILKCSSVIVAKQKNESFKYFIEKFNCEL